MNSAAQALLAETTSSPTRVAGAAADGHRVLIRATRPVLDQLASDLSGTAIGVVLTDARGHLVVRRASRPWSRVPTVRPDGASAVAPITDPSSGRAMGNLVLTFRAADANRLMRPLAALAARAAREIEQRLVDESGFAERLALGRFLRERRGAKGPFVLVTEQRLIPNAAAARLIGRDDEPVLRQAADVLRAGREGGVMTLVVRGGAAAVRAQRIPDDGSPSGTVLQLMPITRDAGGSRHQRQGAPYGWESLTDTERSVAQFVAEGLTNREAAERLFLSRHTIDFHLRSIFRKVGASSRVELTRLVVQAQHEQEGA
jgi:DNA-binding CsgD family transcriptional regulator